MKAGRHETREKLGKPGLGLGCGQIDSVASREGA